jgi:hypothetical protein
VKPVIAIIILLAVGSPVWASEEGSPAPLHPVGLWRFDAGDHSATIDFSGTGMCLVTYLRRGHVQFRESCSWEASGRRINVYPREGLRSLPLTLIAESDAVLEFESDRRLVFHQRSWRQH